MDAATSSPPWSTSPGMGDAGPLRASGCARRLPAEARTGDPRWPLERVLFALAGSVTLLSTALALLVSAWFLALTAFVGINQWLYVLFGACPASLVLRRFFSLRSVIYPRQEAST